MVIEVDPTILMGTIIVATSIVIAIVAAVAKLYSRIGKLEGTVKALNTRVGDLIANR